MRGEELGEAVALTRERAPHVKIEVSGGVRADQLSAIVKAGVDTVSMGALTHSAPAVDIALEVRDERPV